MTSSIVDDLLHVLPTCNMEALLLCARTSSYLRLAVATEIRHRLAVLLQPFFADRTRHWNGLLLLHGAVMSGSLALALFLSPVSWEPRDLDVYVGHDSFLPFVEDFKRLFHFVLEADMSHGHPSSYCGIQRVRRYTNPMGKSLEIIQSRGPNPTFPLLYFWSSVVVNFITPHGAVCAYPKTTLAGKGFITDGFLTSKALKAREKYENRGIVFTEVPAWRAAEATRLEKTRIFSDGPLLVLNFRTVWCQTPLPLPIRPSGSGWLLKSPPFGSHATPFGTIDTALSGRSGPSDRSQLSVLSGAEAGTFCAPQRATSVV